LLASLLTSNLIQRIETVLLLDHDNSALKSRSTLDPLRLIDPLIPTFFDPISSPFQFAEPPPTSSIGNDAPEIENIAHSPSPLEIRKPSRWLGAATP